MRRREFIAGLGSAAAVAWPVMARAQQSLPVVGYVNGASATLFKDLVAAFIYGSTARAEEGYAPRSGAALRGILGTGRGCTSAGLPVSAQ